jgi:hypothetical protein
MKSALRLLRRRRWYSLSPPRLPLATFVRRSLRFAVPTVWGFGIVAALYSLEHYKSLAGRASDITPGPRATTALSSPAKPRLVMYVHPHCPCTRASLAEFQQLVDGAKSRGRELSAEIVVVVPPGIDDSWRDGAIVRAAKELVAENRAGVQLRFNHDLDEALEVGATTSGHTLLFDSEGRRLFRGGITRSRGHAGDNPGTRALTELLNDRKPEVATTPVFGCPLYSPEACRAGEECRDITTPKSLSNLRIEPLPAVQELQE